MTCILEEIHRGGGGWVGKLKEKKNIVFKKKDDRGEWGNKFIVRGEEGGGGGFGCEI